jgi:hypothetical protein
VRRTKLALCLKPILISSAITTPTRRPQRVSKSCNIFMRRHDCALWVETLFAGDALTPRGRFPFEYSTSFRRADDHSHYLFVSCRSGPDCSCQLHFAVNHLLKRFAKGGLLAQRSIHQSARCGTCPLVALTLLSFTVNALTMHAEWIATEHHRLHLIEEWPESPRKAVALSAIQSSLQSLLQNHQPDDPLATCEICVSRKGATSELAFSKKARNRLRLI